MEYKMSVDAAWRKIRAKRHQLPGNASQKSRRLTFAAAMKQSEQFFRLSDQAGYETKPILLYYGLNQAARAIVAVGAPPSEPWQLTGHGVRCPGLNEATVLGDVAVQDSGTGKSFHRLAEHMSSPTLPTRVEFRELWGSLPEGAEVPLQGSDSLFTAVRMKVSREERSRHGVLASPGTSGVRLHRVPAHGYSREGSDELRKLLHKHYPPLRTLAPTTNPHGHISYLIAISADRGSIGLAPAEQGKSYPEPYQLLGYGPETYQRHEDMSTWLVPTIGGNTEPLSPIVTWWAVLYVLSMLARYQPSAWTTMLDIDSSPDAPAVEYLLDEAHRACINLIVVAFKTVEQEAYWQDMAEDPPDE